MRFVRLRQRDNFMLRLLFPFICAVVLSGSALAQTGWGTPVAPTAKPASAVASDMPTLKDIDALRKAVTDAWEKMPLTQRRALFVTEKADLYGHYAARSSSEFKASEKLVTYVEPVGYVWKANGNAYDFGLTVDFAVKSPDGKILSGQEGFGKFAMTSSDKLQEFMLNLTLSLDGAPPGQYILQYRLHDLYSQKTSTIELPFSIVQ
jgi:hypothetical protein